MNLSAQTSNFLRRLSEALLPQNSLSTFHLYIQTLRLKAMDGNTRHQLKLNQKYILSSVLLRKILSPYHTSISSHPAVIPQSPSPTILIRHSTTREIRID